MDTQTFSEYQLQRAIRASEFTFKISEFVGSANCCALMRISSIYNSIFLAWNISRYIHWKIDVLELYVVPKWSNEHFSGISEWRFWKVQQKFRYIKDSSGHKILSNIIQKQHIFMSSACPNLMLCVQIPIFRICRKYRWLVGTQQNWPHDRRFHLSVFPRPDAVSNSICLSEHARWIGKTTSFDLGHSLISRCFLMHCVLFYVRRQIQFQTHRRKSSLV